MNWKEELRDMWHCSPLMCVGIGVLVPLIIGGFYASARQEEEHRAAFMETCLEDHKAYECEALYGQALGRKSSGAAAAAAGTAAGLAIGLSAGRR